MKALSGEGRGEEGEALEAADKATNCTALCGTFAPWEQTTALSCPLTLALGAVVVVGWEEQEREWAGRPSTCLRARLLARARRRMPGRYYEVQGLRVSVLAMRLERTVQDAMPPLEWATGPMASNESVNLVELLTHWLVLALNEALQELQEGG